MSTIAIVYHSGFGHTQALAEAVAKGAESVSNTQVSLIPVADAEAREAELDGADAIIFGSPTYMGGVSAEFAKFKDWTSKRWMEGAWRNKLAAGFTASASWNGDKHNTLYQLLTLALQHGMVWVGLGLPPGYNHSKGSIEDLNRLGASVGAAGLLEDFGQPMTQQWSIGPLISWTLPSSGTHARIHAAEAGADAALAEFDHAVLQALRETQTALDRYAQDLRRLQSLKVAQEQAALAAEQNRRLYQGGRTPYLSSLDADRSLASSDATLAAAEAQVSRDQIHLFLVLGGGWQDNATATAAPTAAR